VPISIADTGDLYVDKRQCVVCGKLTYRLGSESGDKERGEKEPLICNDCLAAIRRDMATEFDLRQRVGSLETRLWVLGLVVPFLLGVLGLLVGRFLL
jgi:hypothetical protein